MFAIVTALGPYTQDQLLGAIVVVVLAALGVGLIYFGIRSLHHAFRIWTNEPVAIEEVDATEGAVEVQGTVEILEDRLAARYSNEPAVAYSYKRKERRERRNDDGQTEYEWETVNQGEEAIPFRVADETGTVAVDPAGADISLDTDRVSGGSSGIQVGTPRTVSDKLYEGRLGPGDTVHVYGQKVHVADGGGPGGSELYIGDGDEITGFSISDTTAFRTGVRYGLKGAGYTIFGVIVIVGIVAYLATYFGMI